MAKVFHDDGTTIYDFGDEFLVRCPRCQACALVHQHYPERPRFACARCGLAREFDEHSSARGGPSDWYFGYPLWLQVPCVGHILWAHNFEHLTFLERLVSAGLRLRHRPADTHYVNRRLAARLPRWMLSAKHRAAVLRGLAELRELAIA
jgi:hypothetical protein